MPLLTAFILGLVGSLHCAAMCGPLILALPRPAHSPRSFLITRMVNQAGRILTYCLLGVIFGLLGATLALAGWQRALSIAAGCLVLSTLVLPARLTPALPWTRLIAAVKSHFSLLLKKRTLPAMLSLGMLNGFLPCGLVYVACASAIASGSILSSVQYMFFFGLGTLPMMLGIGITGPKLQSRFKRPNWLVPACIACVAAALILRGMALGIPYLSPDSAGASNPSCHH